MGAWPRGPAKPITIPAPDSPRCFGWLASIVTQTDAQMGLFANALVGVVGSLLGFWLAGVLGIATTGGIIRFMVALGGAVLLILGLRSEGVLQRA